MASRNRTKKSSSTNTVDFPNNTPQPQRQRQPEQWEQGLQGILNVIAMDHVMLNEKQRNTVTYGVNSAAQEINKLKARVQELETELDGSNEEED